MLYINIRGVMHSLFLRGHECECVCVCVCGGGGGFICDNKSDLIWFDLFFLFIQNIPIRINYIMKYLDSHLYRLC